MPPPVAPTVLWWGRFDPDYSRNRVVRALFAELGWAVADFRPHLSPLGHWEARLRRPPRADLIWLPCFRQRDLAAARRWADRLGVPLVADPLISAWDKQVFEQGKLAPGSAAAERLRQWEGGLLRRADRVVADTPAHAAFFADNLAIPPQRLHVLHVGAEEPLFHPAPLALPPAGAPLEALFYGSFIGLQGPQIIVAAARRYRELAGAPPVRWVLLGDGPLRRECERLAAGLDNLTFEPPLPYPELPARIHRAQLLLGVFGTSGKAGRVIPNKVYQALACGRPVVTRRGEGYPAGVEGIVWTEPGDGASLAAAVAALAAGPAALAALVTLGEAARRTFERHFSPQRIRAELAALLAGL